MSVTALDLINANNSSDNTVGAPRIAYRKLHTSLDRFADRLGAAMKAGIIGDYFNPRRLAVVSKSGSAILTCTDAGSELDNKGESEFISVRIEFVRHKADEASVFLNRFDKAFCTELAV